MAPTSTSSKPKKSAKESLVGKSKAESSGTSSFVAPERRPLGQEDSDEEDEDIDFEQDDSTMIVQNGSNDDDDVMIADGVTLEDAGNLSSLQQSGKGKAKQTKTSTDDMAMSLDTNDKPIFKPLSQAAAQSARDAVDVTRGQLRKVPIPPHRMTPLKNEWPKIYTPLVEMAKLQVRMNVKRKTVEIKVSVAGMTLSLQFLFADLYNLIPHIVL